MNALLRTFLSMSVSGSLLILALLVGKRFLKDRLSRQWQYYIWLIVILRLLVPFGPEDSLWGRTCRALEQTFGPAAAQEAAFRPAQPALDMPEGDLPPAALPVPDSKGVTAPAEDPAGLRPLQALGDLPENLAWRIWLAAALGLLIRKIAAYRGSVRLIRAGSLPVSDPAMLDRLSAAAARAGVRRPVELWVNPRIASPMLTGFLRPCIVLPGTDVPERDFLYIVLHELTHYRRRDLLYKWLVQITVCLHWFNPLVHWMGREISRACEFSCDEAVLIKMGAGSARDYGETLLDAMAAVGRPRETPGAVTLSENKQLLKERLSAIMNFKRKSPAVRAFTLALTLCLGLGAVFAGVYPYAAAKEPEPAAMDTIRIKGEVYYLVRTEAQLRSVGKGRYGLDQNYMQQSDIALSPAEWTPIGTRKKPFTGTFNGNGFEITGLTMTDPKADLVGLFGVAAGGAEIYNVTLRDFDIQRAGRDASGKSVGAIVAIARGGRSYDNFVYPKEASGQGAGGLTEIGRYYASGSLPLFQTAFSRLDPKEQGEWLNRICADQNIAALGAAVTQLEEDCGAVRSLAETAYQEDNAAFFSVLSQRMGQKTLELWLDRATEDGKWAFQSLLFGTLDREEEFDDLEAQKEKEWAEAQRAAYRAVGVTVSGKDYYYQGKLVNIFLDVRANGSFYTLNLNPKGTVNVRILRDAGNGITGAARMSDAEAEVLLADMRDDDEDDWDEEEDDWTEDWTEGRILHPQVIPIQIDSAAAGSVTDLGTFTLSRGDRIWYGVTAETGRGMEVYFAKRPNQSPRRWAVHNLRQGQETLTCAASFTVETAEEAGTWHLYLRASEGALGKVQGWVSLAAAE